jgi:hypothetical protein
LQVIYQIDGGVAYRVKMTVKETVGFSPNNPLSTVKTVEIETPSSYSVGATTTNGPTTSLPDCEWTI